MASKVHTYWHNLLYDLLGQSSSTEMSIDQFRERQVNIWQTHFKSFFHYTTNLQRWGSNCSISTHRWSRRIHNNWQVEMGSQKRRDTG
jgi:hypothetical protein